MIFQVKFWIKFRRTLPAFATGRRDAGPPEPRLSDLAASWRVARVPLPGSGRRAVCRRLRADADLRPAPGPDGGGRRLGRFGSGTEASEWPRSALSGPHTADCPTSQGGALDHTHNPILNKASSTPDRFPRRWSRTGASLGKRSALPSRLRCGPHSLFGSIG